MPRKQELSLIIKSKTVIIELVSMVVLAFFIVSFLTSHDISTHDFYVKPIISECYSGNDSVFCENLRQLHGCEPTAQMCLGAIYWNGLASIGFFVGILLVAIRLIFALLLKVYINKRVTSATVLMIITYFIFGSGLFFFGFLDTFYYLFQGDDIPQTLDWLNGAGIFTESKKWFGDPNTVEIEDLLATNALGMMIIGLFGLSTMVLYASLRKSPNGIA